MLIVKETSNTLTWGIWKIEEGIDTLLSMLSNTPEFIALKDNTTSESRLLEKVAVRVLLKNLIGEENSVNYQPNGSPYLSDSSLHISISHTRNYAAVVLSKTEGVGIDIEYISERVKRIRSKFIGKTEYIDPENEIIHLLLHWSGKESMYKGLNKEGIDLRKELIVEKFVPETKGVFYAHGGGSLSDIFFTIQYQTTKDYVLTLAFCQTKN